LVLFKSKILYLHCWKIEEGSFELQAGGRVEYFFLSFHPSPSSASQLR
jgi:hypothetical protein